VFLQLISHLPSPNYTAKETFLHAPRQSGWKGSVEVKFLATTNSAALMMVTPAYMMTTTKSLFPRATRKQHKSCWLTTGNLLRCSSEIPSPLLASLRQTLVSLCVRARAPLFYHCSVKSEKKNQKIESLTLPEDAMGAFARVAQPSLALVGCTCSCLRPWLA
jgi:hypothetical protein